MLDAEGLAMSMAIRGLSLLTPSNWEHKLTEIWSNKFEMIILLMISIRQSLLDNVAPECQGTNLLAGEKHCNQGQVIAWEVGSPITKPTVLFYL